MIRKGMIRLLMVIFVATIINSCATQSFIFNKNYHEAEKSSYETQKIFKNWGLGDEQVLYNPSSYCKRNEILAKIDLKNTNYKLEFLSLGYFQPRTIEIYCIDSSFAK